jgi:hypothetical protein
VEAEGNRFRRRRRITLLAIVAIFAITAAILVLSVVHAELGRPQLGNYTEFTCGVEDVECRTLICPQGYMWQQQTDSCTLKEGEQCTYYNTPLKKTLPFKQILTDV